MVDPLFEIKDRIALITGVTSGIGLMIARGLVARGKSDCRFEQVPMVGRMLVSASTSILGAG